MLDTITGLPTHVLVVHAAVVLVPVAALITVAVAVRRVWAARFAWWAAALDAVAVVLAWVTRESGEKLLERVAPGSSARTPALEDHVALGGDLLWYSLGLLAAAVLVALVSHPPTLARLAPGGLHRAVPMVMTVLAIVAAVLVTVQTVRAGHSGSSAVWRPLVENT